MTGIMLLSQMLGININFLDRKEVIIVEADLLSRVCYVLNEMFRKSYQNYFRLMRYTTEKENSMLDHGFLCLVIRDILSTDEYDLKGIACYTDTHEEVLEDILEGRNLNPSALLLRRSIELHRSVRRELYQSIMHKVIADMMQNS